MNSQQRDDSYLWAPPGAESNPHNLAARRAQWLVQQAEGREDLVFNRVWSSFDTLGGRCAEVKPEETYKIAGPGKRPTVRDLLVIIAQRHTAGEVALILYNILAKLNRSTFTVPAELLGGSGFDVT